ncbi:hypothetical protein G9F32_06240 [Acinetobacter sp. 194]|uniref:PepSY domain-containing protein n=1 Tax=Acinetobacter shaoyimingii TaxID=2715164 RepID=UPI0014085B5C|nr:sulfite reductase flavoprotein subunit alpha [Acinetobacter shaoyimingii]NHB57632.1 hypothetical protein [Acinetobacter shaoyimingii]
MLKKTFFQIHWFLGITAGLILSIMGVTGAIYSYEQPILKWMNQDSYVVQAETKAKMTPAEIYQHFQQERPEFKINSISVASSATESSSINIEKEGERRGYTMMINPYNAELLPSIQGKAFFAFVQKLHRYLAAGEVGKQITGACTLFLLYFILSGIYLRWPKKHTIRQWFAVKPKLTGRNFIWDLHAVVGTWVFVFYFIIACTGLTWSYSWWKNGMYKVLGVEAPQSNMQGRDSGQKPSKSEHSKKEHASGSNEHKAEGDAEDLNPSQIQTALHQTWSGIQAQLGREYSTMTLNLPKKDNGKLELVFVDPIPQHERARNKATYNYQTHKFENIDIYADKKLNDKIMSSLLPVHRGSFFGPIYQFFAMLAALSMPLFFVTGWMLYLKRRKQKKLTQAARGNVLNAENSADATPWLITYATQTGVSEQVAWNTATSLQQVGQPVTVKAIQHLTEDDFKQSQRMLFVVSTYGTGTAPDLALNFAKKFLDQSFDLSHLHYAVLALGSQDYPETYCAFGHRIDAWLKQNHAQALFECIEVDNGNSKHIEFWNTAIAQATQLDLQTVTIQKTFDEWTLSCREMLNPNSQGAPAFNIQLTTKHDMHWEAGDIAEIQPGNSPARIDSFLQKHNIPADTILGSLNISIENALWNKDLTQEVHSFKDIEELYQQLKDLPTREYSIASIPPQQTLRLVVRQKYDEQGQLGLGSGWLTEHTQLNNPIHLRIRSNPSFHLITDNRPMICIGNGTGIAGLMSLISARIRLDYTNNWLIFGERQFAHDFFYKEIIQAWQNTSMLKRLDLAFSRDQAEKVYVHHKLREQASELKTWIDQGAVIYVCGSIQGMASDVDQALNDILGVETVDLLRQEGRYRRDVY